MKYVLRTYTASIVKLSSMKLPKYIINLHFIFKFIAFVYPNFKIYDIKIYFNFIMLLKRAGQFWRQCVTNIVD